MLRQWRGGEIASIAEGSVGEAFGLRPGDRLLAIDGRILRDIIDYQFYGAEEQLELRVLRGGSEMTLQAQRLYGQSLGLEFSEAIFDGIRRCSNQCEFCFVSQMPGGLRDTLYVKDDDYRLSFLAGSYITLTNLTDADWARLAEQRLTPLYVSVHATEPEVRRQVFGRPVPDIRCQLRRLGDLGISVHGQIVLVPGLNDGEHLARTVRDLADLHPVVESVAVVPVGLTRLHVGHCRVHTPQEARALLSAVGPWQEAFRRTWRVGFTYCADEWYLLGGEPIPPSEAYDGFPQLENGVGLTRQLVDDWQAARGVVQPGGDQNGSQVTLVCGTLIAPVLQDLGSELANLAGLQVRVVPVVNSFFGPKVTVSGLLTGEDVVAALKRRPPGDAVVLPRRMFDAAGDRTLDDWTLERIEDAVGVPVWRAECFSDIAQRIGTLVG